MLIIMTADELKQQLKQFYGTEYYHKYQWLNLTDGVKFLCDNANCYWLIDILLSIPSILTAESFCVLVLNRVGDNARLRIHDGDRGGGEKVFYRQTIPWTDFPFDTFTLFIQQGVVMLPSEY